MTSKSQLDALTGARGLAAWYVVLYHVRGAFDGSIPPVVIEFLSKGYLAVDLFFVLSGFVMWLNYGPKFEAEGLMAAPDFLKRRLARIYPLHFVMLTLFVAFACLLAVTGRDLSGYPFAELPLHYTLSHNWGFTEALAWNDPAWSISTEFGAYLALPFTALLIRKLPRQTWSDAALILCLAAVLASVFARNGAEELGIAISELGLLRCLAEFFIGVLVCRIWQREAKAGVAIAAVIATGLVLVLALGFATEIWTAPTFFAALVYLLARSSSAAANPFSSRLLVHLGNISYSTYLAHCFLWVMFKIAFVNDVENVSTGLMLLFIAGTYGASELLYRFVEVPGRQWMQQVQIPYLGKPVKACP
jgi:peptidoglycan/LPS O-acetylase OafA/YrhL